MEFLKSLFEKGALTWEQFQQAAKDAKFEVVNASGGAYVPKADLDTKAQELTTATEQDSNLHASRHTHLKRARLPFRHLGILCNTLVTTHKILFM